MNLKVLSYAAGQSLSRVVPQGAMDTALRLAAVPYGRAAGKLEPLKDNLRVALAAEGKADEAEVRRLSEENLKNFASNLCDLSYAGRLSDSFIRSHVEIRGLELLNEALSKKKGVIIASAHVGNWELGGMVLSRLGYPLTAVALEHRQRSVNDAFQKKREENGIKVIFLGQDPLKACYRVLKENGVLAMVGDILFGKEGIPVDFLDRKILYPKGIARFSLSTGAPALPTFFLMTSKKPRRYLLEVGEALRGSSEEEMTQNFAKKVEAMVRRVPAQWFDFKRFWEPHHLFGPHCGPIPKESNQTGGGGVALLPKLTPDRVLVLIPAYNEAGKIGTVIGRVKEQRFRVLVSDDGSDDDTAAIAERLGANVLRAKKNEGKGASLRKGLEEFLKTDLAAVILMDSDGQHDPDDLGRFLDVLRSGVADVVIGSRMETPVGMSWIRRLTNRLMSGVLSVLSGQKVSDSQCGYRAMTRRAAQRISIRSDRFEVESEIILEASRHELKIVSIPITCCYGEEQSRIRPLRDTLRFLKFLVVFHLKSR